MLLLIVRLHLLLIGIGTILRLFHLSLLLIRLITRLVRLLVDVTVRCAFPLPPTFLFI